MLKRIAVVILFACLLAAQVNAPERRVEKNVILSERDPKVRIELPKSVQYAGGDRWVLYDIADCELHAFVEADTQKKVERLYWVQFEGYIPSRPELKHQYDSPQHTTIGGMDFYVDAWVRANCEQTRAGSDREHTEALIRSHRYQMPTGMMYVRLVHLLDEQKRKELMIIYGEDLSAMGFTVADLREGGKAYDRWPSIAKGLVEEQSRRSRSSRRLDRDCERRSTQTSY